MSLAPLFAHDMWIEPTHLLSSSRPDRRRAVARRAGSARRSAAARSRARQSVRLRGCGTAASPWSAATAPIPRASCASPRPALLVIGYRSNPSAVELTAEKFNQYLKEEGLDAVAALRASRNETGAKAHELFSRCAKSLVLSGSPTEAQGDRRLGFTLELVAERNPYAIPTARIFRCA